MLHSIEGIYKDGLIHLAEVPPGISESQVVVTFLGAKPTPPTGQTMSFGMFAGSNQSTEDDLQGAEFCGDSDDGLDWS